MATDTIIARAWADGVARLIPAVVAPALAYGSSGEHQDFPGTLSIGGPTLRSVVVELARSAQHSFEQVVFLSGHSGNATALNEAVALLRTEGHQARAFFPSWDSDGPYPIDAHAGRTETSLLFHLAPDQVRPERLEAGEGRPVDQIMADLVDHGVRAVSANGVLGDPRRASAEEGRWLLDDLVSRTVTALTDGRSEPSRLGLDAG